MILYAEVLMYQILQKMRHSVYCTNPELALAHLLANAYARNLAFYDIYGLFKLFNHDLATPKCS